MVALHKNDVNLKVEVEEYDGKLFRLYLNDSIIGHCTIKEYSNTLWSMHIFREEHRGKGYGQFFMEEVLTLYKKRPVILTCYADRQAFYKRCGFIRKNTKDTEPYTMIYRGK